MVLTVIDYLVIAPEDLVISSKEVAYATSSSYVNPATLAVSAWSTSYPASLPEGTWLHTRTTLVYSDGNSTVTYMSSYVGRNGTSPIFADITNEHGGVVCDSSGNTTGGEQSVSTKALMYLGNTLQTLTSIVCKVEGTTLGTAYTDNADPTRCFRAVSYPSTGTITVYVRNGSYLKTEDVIITVSANINGSTVSKDLRLSLSGSWAGSDGAPAVLYELEPSVDVVSRDSDSIPLYDSISFKVKKSVGGTISEVSNWSTEGLTLYHNVGGSDVSDGTVSGATKTISGIQSGLYKDNSKVEWILKKGNDVVDREGIGSVDNGENGNDGVSYEIRSTVDSVTIASDETAATMNVTFDFFKKEADKDPEAYSCYYALFSRKGTSYSRLSYNTTKVTTKSYTNQSTTVEGITPDAFVMFIGKNAFSASSLSSAAPTSYQAKKEIIINKLGDTGGEGKDAERYWIEVSDGTREVRFTSDFAGTVSGTPSTISLLLKHLKGSTEETLNSVPSGYSMKFLNSGGSWVTINPGSRNMASDLDNGSYSPAVYRLLKGNTELCRVSIRAVWEYQRMLLPAGKYTSKEYTRTPTTTPLVLHESSGEYWFLVADTNKVDNNYIGPKDTNQQVWQKANDYEVVLTKMLFALFAKIGGFIVYGNYFLSQYGTLVGPNGKTVVKESNVNIQYNGITPIVLNGNENDDIIVCKVAFYATANSQIKITLTPSSELNYDFGAIGVLGTESSPGNSKWLESATEETIKNTSVGTYMLKKASGTTPVDTTITIPSTGEYFIEIAYARDVDSDNDDKATFVFEKKSGTVTWRELTKIKSGPYMTYSGYCQSAVPYGWFDPEDPMAEKVPATGYKFRPTKCINALTGEEWLAGGKVHVSKGGDMEMRDISVNDAIIEGSLMYHKIYVDKADNYIRPFTFWNANGVGIDIDGSATVKKITLHYDTIIISGSKRSSAYNLFTGIVCTGYTVILPPARFFVGMRIKIINGTISGSNGTAASRNPSPINLAVIYRADTEEYKDMVEQSYTANMIVAAIPMTFNKGGYSFTFIGSPDSNKCEDFTPSTAENFTVFGLKGDSTTVYRSMELVAQKNPYISTYNTTQNGQDASDYAWMIIDAQQ